MKKIKTEKLKLYFIILVIFTLLSFSKKSGYSSLALPALVGLCYNGFPLLGLFITYQLANLVCFNLLSCALELLSSAIIVIVFFIYRKRKPKIELALYVLLSLLPFLHNGITLNKAVYMLINLLLCFISVVAIKVLFINKFRYALTIDEVFSASIFICVISLGIISFLTTPIYKAIAIFFILFCLYTLDTYALLCACVLALPLCYTTHSIEPIGIFMIYAIVGLTTIKYSRFLSSVLVIATEVSIYYLTNIYNNYTYLQLTFFIISAFIFAFLPKSYMQNIKEKVFKFKERKLPKLAINRMRTTISANLFEVSCALSDMQESISSIKKITLTEEQIKDNVIKKVVEDVCLTCPLKNTCQHKKFPSYELLFKLASIGLARGKLTLIDLPIEFTKNCSFFSNILYSYNQQISFYNETLKQSRTFVEETELLSLQTQSLSGVLKEFASSYSKTLPFYSEQEKLLAKHLHKNGIVFSEIMVFGEDKDLEINVVLEKSEYDSKNLVKVLSTALGFNVIPEKVVLVSVTFVSVCYKKAPILDAVFGLSQRAKNNGNVCGDTHSLLKLGIGKFVVAINDGMGSGECANKISALSTNLIESFYKAGLDTKLVLKTVNKILSVTSSETFTALDLAIIDLYAGFCEFIKIGSPYGYIIEKNGIKIVEASSLPLGTVDKMDVLPAKSIIEDGDIIVLISDGISDAFGSSTDVLDFLKTQNVLNPQTLADSLVNKAIQLDGTPKDDMTALCVKVYNKAI